MENLSKIVILEQVEKGLICTQQPTNVCMNSTYVVNLHSLDDPSDIRADENGVWVRTGSPVTYVSLHQSSSGSHHIHKRSKLGKSSHHYKLIRTYYRHADSPDFRRIITTAEGNANIHYTLVTLISFLFSVACISISLRGIGFLFLFCTDHLGHQLRLAFIQYSFMNHEHPIQLRPHGNSKGHHSKTPFRRTKPSALHRLQKGVVTKSPLQVLTDIQNDAGGVTGAKAGCDLPHNRQQAYNARKSTKSINDFQSHSRGYDTLAEVMRLCKESISTNDAFIRSVESAPEPMCVVATQQQLVDMERFCILVSISLSCLLTQLSILVHSTSLLSPTSTCLQLQGQGLAITHLYLVQCWCTKRRHSMPFIILPRH